MQTLLNVMTVSTVEELRALEAEGKLAGSILKVPSAVYHKGPGFSSSGLKEVLRSPAHYRAYLEAPPKDSAALRIGTLIHLAVLEPDLFESSIVVMPKFEGEGMRKKKAEWLEANQGKTVADPDERAVAVAVRDALFNSPLASNIIKEGQAELSAYWIDEETGILCKARADYLRDGMIFDLKSCDDASAGSFGYAIRDFRYYLSAAFYLDGFSKALGTKLEHFAWIAAEKKPPHGIAYYVADETCIAHGRDVYKQALRTVAECRRTGHWPAYELNFKNISLPSWYLTKEAV